MTTEEIAVYETIAGTYLLALQTDEQWAVRLAGLEQLMNALLKKLEGFGSDNPDVVGQRV